MTSAADNTRQPAPKPEPLHGTFGPPVWGGVFLLALICGVSFGGAMLGTEAARTPAAIALVNLPQPLADGATAQDFAAFELLRVFTVGDAGATAVTVPQQSSVTCTNTSAGVDLYRVEGATGAVATGYGPFEGGADLGASFAVPVRTVYLRTAAGNATVRCAIVQGGATYGAASFGGGGGGGGGGALAGDVVGPAATNEVHSLTGEDFSPARIVNMLGTSIRKLGDGTFGSADFSLVSREPSTLAEALLFLSPTGGIFRGRSGGTGSPTTALTVSGGVGTTQGTLQSADAPGAFATASTSVSGSDALARLSATNTPNSTSVDASYSGGVGTVTTRTDLNQRVMSDAAEVFTRPQRGPNSTSAFNCNTGDMAYTFNSDTDQGICRTTGGTMKIQAGFNQAAVNVTGTVIETQVGNVIASVSQTQGIGLTDQNGANIFRTRGSLDTSAVDIKGRNQTSGALRAAIQLPRSVGATVVSSLPTCDLGLLGTMFYLYDSTGGKTGKLCLCSTNANTDTFQWFGIFLDALSPDAVVGACSP